MQHFETYLKLQTRSPYFLEPAVVTFRANIILDPIFSFLHTGYESINPWNLFSYKQTESVLNWPSLQYTFFEDSLKSTDPDRLVIMV